MADENLTFEEVLRKQEEEALYPSKSSQPVTEKQPITPEQQPPAAPGKPAQTTTPKPPEAFQTEQRVVGLALEPSDIEAESLLKEASDLYDVPADPAEQKKILASIPEGPDKERYKQLIVRTNRPGFGYVGQNYAATVIGTGLENIIDLGKEAAHKVAPGTFDKPKEKEKVPLTEKLTEKSPPPKEWYDPKTKTIFDLEKAFKYDEFKSKEEKEKFHLFLLTNMIPELSPTEVRKARVTGNIKNPVIKSVAEIGQGLDAFLFGELGSAWAAIGLNKLGKEGIPPPPKGGFLKPDEANYVNQVLEARKQAVARGEDPSKIKGTLVKDIATIDIPLEAKSLADVEKEVWEKVLGTARDIFFGAGQNLIVQNAGVINLMNTARKGIMGTAAKIANPIAGPLEKGIIKVLTKNGVKAGKKTQLLAETMAQTIEGAVMAQPSHAEGLTPENVAISALGGAGLPVAGKGAVKIVEGTGKVLGLAKRKVISRGSRNPVEATPEQEAKAARADEVLKNAPATDSATLKKIADGEVPLQNVPPEVTQALRQEAAELAKAKGIIEIVPPDSRSVEIAYTHGVDDPKIRELIDYQIMLHDGMTVEQKAIDFAMKDLMLQADEGKRQDIDAAMKSHEYKANMDNVDNFKAWMGTTKLAPDLNAFDHFYSKYQNDSKLVRQKYLTEAMKIAVDSADDIQAKEFGIQVSDSHLIKNVIKALDNPVKFDQAAVKWKELDDGLTKKIVNMSDTMKKLEKIDDPRIGFIKQHIDEAVSSNRPVNRAYLIDEIRRVNKDLQGESATQLTRLAQQALGYNNTLSRMDSVKQDVLTAYGQQIHAGKQAEIAKERTAPYEMLAKSALNYSDPKQISARFNEHVNTALQNPRIDPVLKNGTQAFIAASAQNIALGMPIPKQAIDNFKMEIEKAKGIPGVNALRDVANAVSLWNKETVAINTLKNMGLNEINNTADLVAAIPAFQKASKEIITPRNLARLGIYQTYLSSVWGHNMLGSGLPDKVQMELFQTFFGSNQVKFKLQSNPETQISSQNHAINVMQALQFNSLDILNALDSLHQKVLGKPLNRAYFLSRVATPQNGYGVTRNLERLLVNSDEFKSYVKAAERDKKPPNWLEKFYTFFLMNSEAIDSKIARETGVTCLNDVMEIQKKEKEASQKVREVFDPEISFMEKKINGVWGLTSFKNAANIIQGSDKLHDLGDVMYLQHRDGTITLTDIGNLTKRLFTEQDTFDSLRQSITEGRVDDARGLIRETLTSIAGPDKAKEMIDKGFDVKYLNYIRNDNLWKGTVNPNIWKEAFAFIDYSTGLRSKVWDVHEAVFQAQNKEYSARDIYLTAKKWREDYIQSRRDSSETLLDYNDSIYMTDDASDYFGSSKGGQLAKTKGLELNNLMHPVLALMHDMQAITRDSYTAHARTSLENHGILLNDLGFITQSNILMEGVKQQANKLQRIASDVKRALTPYNLPVIGPAVAPLMNALGKTLFGMYQPIQALASPGSLFKNALQHMFQTAAYTKEGYFGVIPNARTLLDTGLSFLPFSINTMILSMSPEAYAAATKFAKAQRDNLKRGQMTRIENIARYAPRGEMINILGNEIKLPAIKATSSLARLGGSLEKAADASNEFIMGAKERAEFCMSKQAAERGSQLLERSVPILKKDGINAFYEAIRPHFSMKTDAHVWKLAYYIDKALKNGEDLWGSVVSQDFIQMYHDNAIGRFGPRNSPRIIRDIGLGALAPQTTRFISPRTNDLNRLGMLAGAGFDKAVNFLTNKHGVPSEISRQMLYSVMAAATSTAILGAMVGGVSSLFGFSLFDKSEEELETTPMKLLRHGTGIEYFKELAPSQSLPALYDAMAKGGLTSLSFLTKQFYDTQRQKGVPFFGAEEYAVYKSLQEANEIFGDSLPFLNAFDSQLQRNEKTIEELNEGIVRLMQQDTATKEAVKYELNGRQHVTTNPDEVRKKIDSLLEENAELKEKYKTVYWERVADFIAKRSPLTSWLAATHEPFFMAMAVTTGKAAHEREKYDAAARWSKERTPSFLSSMQQLFGLTSAGEDNSVIFQKMYDVTYSNLAKYGLMSEEKAKVYAEEAKKWDAILTEWDMSYTLFMEAGKTPGKKTLESVRQKLHPIIPFRQEEIFEHEVPKEILEEDRYRTKRSGGK